MAGLPSLPVSAYSDRLHTSVVGCATILDLESANYRHHLADTRGLERMQNRIAHACTLPLWFAVICDRSQSVCHAQISTLLPWSRRLPRAADCRSIVPASSASIRRGASSARYTSQDDCMTELSRCERDDERRSHSYGITTSPIARMLEEDYFKYVASAVSTGKVPHLNGQ